MERAVELYMEDRLTLKQVGTKLGAECRHGAAGAVTARSEDAGGGGEENKQRMTGER